MARRGDGIYQRGRIYVILASLCALLGVATSASAECAWVLWVQEGNLWETYEAFEKKAACDSGLVKAQSRFESLALRQKKLGMDARMVFLQCLPDTVDPRGPKGTK